MSASTGVPSPLLDRPRIERVLLAFVVVENAWSTAASQRSSPTADGGVGWAHASAATAVAWGPAKLASPHIIKRPRPNLNNCPPARNKSDNESFPSSHATTSFAAAVALPPLVPAGRC
jgi:membrane-associated phospholipid phosphatase